MEDNTDVVWNAITDSAKKKFDFNKFEEKFVELGENIADNIIFKIIIGYASEETCDSISAKLFSEMLMFGFIWELEDIKEFVNDKDKVFKLEIYLSQLAGDLLEDGNDPLMVLSTVDQLLD